MNASNNGGGGESAPNDGGGGDGTTSRSAVTSSGKERASKDGGSRRSGAFSSMAAEMRFDGRGGINAFLAGIPRRKTAAAADGFNPPAKKGRSQRDFLHTNENM